MASTDEMDDPLLAELLNLDEVEADVEVRAANIAATC
jgi:hypothetical protein